MKKYILTQTQIKTLADIAGRFPEIEQFDIVEENSSGIGPTTTVRFELLGKDVKIDNTDVSNWY
jgi:hypothetical protein